MKQKVLKAVDVGLVFVPATGAYLWLCAVVWGGFLRSIGL